MIHLRGITLACTAATHLPRAQGGLAEAAAALRATIGHALPPMGAEGDPNQTPRELPLCPLGAERVGGEVGDGSLQTNWILP